MLSVAEGSGLVQRSARISRCSDDHDPVLRGGRRSTPPRVVPVARSRFGQGEGGLVRRGRATADGGPGRPEDVVGSADETVDRDGPQRWRRCPPFRVSTTRLPAVAQATSTTLVSLGTIGRGPYGGFGPAHCPDIERLVAGGRRGGTRRRPGKPDLADAFRPSRSCTFTRTGWPLRRHLMMSVPLPVRSMLRRWRDPGGSCQRGCGLPANQLPTGRPDIECHTVGMRPTTASRPRSRDTRPTALGRCRGPLDPASACRLVVQTAPCRTKYPSVDSARLSGS